VWLLIPYLVWSLAVFAARWLESCEEGCRAEPVGRYLQNLLLGKADPAYWYVFVLTLLMIVAPFLAQMAHARWRSLLSTSLILLFGIRLLPYLNLVIAVPVLPSLHQPFLLLFSQVFYFALGLVFRSHLDEMRRRVERLRVLLPWIVIVFAGLALIDTELFSRFDLDGDGLSPDHAHASVFAEGYAIAIILSLMTFERIPVPATRALVTLGSFVYGIYLLHPLLLEYLARAVHRLAPRFLAYPIAFQLYLVAGGVGLPLLLMSAVKHSSFRRYYRYLFG
jgi:surface polysaccharide O-acyltransferase-like enzyme